jgi:secreted trypsin-like serine protease
MARTALRRGFFATAACVLIGLASVCTALPAQAKTAPQPSPRIVGGDFVPNTIPWMAALHTGTVGGTDFVCTATQINRNWILTAAHCVENPGSYWVRIGSLNRSSGGTTRTISQIVMHPSFAWPAYDIALLRMSSAFTNSSYSPLAVTADVRANQSAAVYGWGSERADWGPPLPERLKYALGTVSSTNCHSPVLGLICTQTNGSIAGGDSGGPAFVLSPATNTWVQAGVCAVGHRPAGDGWAAYTAVHRLRTWIRDTSGT